MSFESRTRISMEVGELRENCTGYVYLIETDIGAYKIGRTNDLGRRVLDFGGASVPFRWRMIHAIHCHNPEWAEKNLHRIFCRRRIRGEWFKLSPADVSFLMSLPEIGSFVEPRVWLPEIPEPLEWDTP